MSKERMTVGQAIEWALVALGNEVSNRDPMGKNLNESVQKMNEAMLVLDQFKSEEVDKW